MNAISPIVVCGSAAGPDARQSAELAEQLCLDLVTGPVIDETTLVLGFVNGHLELRDGSMRPGRGVWVNLRDFDLRPGTPGLSRRQPLARAVGAPVEVVDATAGLGRDTVLLAALGCRVTAIERSPVVAALLADGLRRAAAHDALAELVGDRIELQVGDARQLLPALPPPPVVYIDPMFPPRRKRGALPKKSIRLVRQVVGDDPDADELARAARQVVRGRVVVKRPVHAPPLLPDPVSQHRGKLARYDVYRPESD